MKIGAVVLDSSNSEMLSEFYKELLGWEKIKPDDEWIIVYNKETDGTALVFQQIENYVKPVCPEERNEQQQMLHLDFYVEPDKFNQEVEHALKCRAQKSSAQFSDNWVVMIDPVGHPFCIIPFVKPAV